MRTPRNAASVLAVLLALALFSGACADDSGSDDAATDDSDTTAAPAGGGDGDAATAAEPSGDAAGDAVFPTADEWPAADPADHGLDQADLDALATYLEGFDT